jgi:hypothetical protein
VHAKFMALGTHVPHVIHDFPTKWHTKFQHIFVVIPFL